MNQAKVLILVVALFGYSSTFAMESVQQKYDDRVDEVQIELCIDKLETIQKWWKVSKHDYFRFLHQKWAEQCPSYLVDKYSLHN